MKDKKEIITEDEMLEMPNDEKTDIKQPVTNKKVTLDEKLNQESDKEIDVVKNSKEVSKMKNKKLILGILIALLIVNILALTIYIIGIDKVINLFK
ncbi:MAG: hypothetical protein RSB54_01385 [Bacilli bacterium]